MDGSIPSTPDAPEWGAFDLMCAQLKAHGSDQPTGQEWLCPAHDDQRPSLSVNIGEDGRALVKCHAGCTLDAVLDAIGLAPSDISGQDPPEAVYSYQDSDGDLAFQLVRFPGRKFRVRHFDRIKGEWAWNAEGIQKVPFRLGNVLRAAFHSEDVWIAEGEKDVLALEDAGVIATCNPFGAGAWRPEYAASFEGVPRAHVVADKDEAGKKHAIRVARSLSEVVPDVRVVEALEGKDAFDHLTAGHGLPDFIEIPLPVPEMAETPSTPPTEKAGQELPPHRIVKGGEFIFAESPVPPAIWGDGARVLAVEGEPTLIVGQTGVGKTTLAQALVLRRMGVIAEGLLGLSVPVDDRPILYIAADRPRQIGRSFRRLVEEEDRLLLEERLLVHQGPLHFDLVAEPGALARLAVGLGVGLLVIDSLTNVCPDLSKEDVGARYNLAVQTCVAEGVEVIVLHHQRKQGQGRASARTIDDVFGSKWITAGAGSVVSLEGAPGDSRAEIRHLKQPSEAVGPLAVRMLRESGDIELDDSPGPVECLREAGVEGLTVRQAASLMFGSTKRDACEKARRRMNALVNRDLVTTYKEGGTARYVWTGE